MKTAEDKAIQNIFKVADKIKQLQLQSPNESEIEYRLGELFLHMPANEVGILESLQEQGVIKIMDAYGSDSSR